MPPDTGTADLAVCRALLAEGSKSFALASRLLPRRVRDPATALYAFCRVADDEVDDESAQQLDTIADLALRVDQIYRGRPREGSVDRALARVVEQTDLPRAILDALIEGFAWDAEGRRYETLDELHDYGARVAGTVGAAMAVLMGRRSSYALERACELGVAMQLTNIARDVAEDAARGRLYLPLDLLREAGLDPDELVAHPKPSAELAYVIQRVLSEADALYRRADEGIAHLPRDCRIAIRAARLVYSEIGRRVIALGEGAITRRTIVPKWRKIALAIQSSGAWFWTPTNATWQPLRATRFLVSAAATRPTSGAAAVR
jgi:phytoene synthase